MVKVMLRGLPSGTTAAAVREALARAFPPPAEAPALVYLESAATAAIGGSGRGVERLAHGRRHGGRSRGGDSQQAGSDQQAGINLHWRSLAVLVPKLRTGSLRGHRSANLDGLAGVAGL